MNPSTFLKRAAIMATASAALAGVAHAQNNFTDAGENVSNTFTLAYEVDGSTQPTITNDTTSTDPNVEIQGTETEFTVDRLIDLTVTALDSPQIVAPNSTGTFTPPVNVVTFRVENLGNDNQAYDLTTAESGDYVPTNVAIRYFIDLDGDDTFDAGTETYVTYNPGDATADIAPDQSFIVEITSDVPASANDGDSIDIVLTADTLNPVTSVEPGFTGTAGDETLPDDGTNVPTGLAENVLADGQGDTDALNDGAFSDTATLNVASPDLDATKSVTVLDTDPADAAACAGLTTPAVEDTTQYSVPGACVEYIIEVTNNGATAAALAEGININDILPEELTFVSASFAGFDAAPVPTLTAPAASPTVCDGTATTCEVDLDGAALSFGQTGQLIIRALVQ